MKARWTSEQSRRWTLRYVALVVTAEAVVVLGHTAGWWR